MSMAVHQPSEAFMLLSAEMGQLQRRSRNSDKSVGSLHGDVA